MCRWAAKLVIHQHLHFCHNTLEQKKNKIGDTQGAEDERKGKEKEDRGWIFGKASSSRRITAMLGRRGCNPRE